MKDSRWKKYTKTRKLVDHRTGYWASQVVSFTRICVILCTFPPFSYADISPRESAAVLAPFFFSFYDSQLERYKGWKKRKEKKNWGNEDCYACMFSWKFDNPLFKIGNAPSIHEWERFMVCKRSDEKHEPNGSVFWADSKSYPKELKGSDNSLYLYVFAGEQKLSGVKAKIETADLAELSRRLGEPLESARENQNKLLIATLSYITSESSLKVGARDNLSRWTAATGGILAITWSTDGKFVN